MNLYLLRHGLAANHNPRRFAKDAERPLTSKGKRKLRESAGALKRLKLSFDLIVTSPYTRARDTAQIVAEELDFKKDLVFTEFLTPSGSQSGLVKWLHDRDPLPENVLLVGHDPHLSELLSLLLAGNTQAFTVELKKGGLCKLSIETLKPGRCAVLEWLLTPKHLCQMA
jgi:phosphohistidine phosphatase